MKDLCPVFRRKELRVSDNRGTVNGFRIAAGIFCLFAGAFGIFVVTTHGATSPAAYIAIPAVIISGIISIATSGKQPTGKDPQE